jgi:hypothetical protein
MLSLFYSIRFETVCFNKTHIKHLLKSQQEFSDSFQASFLRGVRPIVRQLNLQKSI